MFLLLHINDQVESNLHANVALKKKVKNRDYQMSRKFLFIIELHIRIWIQSFSKG